MKKIYKMIALFALMSFLLMPTQAVQAQGPEGGGKVVFGEDFTLKSGDTLGGDLVVFGGNVTIEEDAIVNGSVVVFGGNVEFAKDSKINGNTVMIGSFLSCRICLLHRIHRLSTLVRTCLGKQWVSFFVLWLWPHLPCC